jgi:hypothetical protein
MNIRPPNVTGIVTGVVLTLIVSGGAAVGAKLITGNDIKNGTITTKDIKNGTVSSDDLKNNNVKSGDIQDGTVATKDLAKGSVTANKLAAGSVTASKLAPDAVAFPNAMWGPMIRNQNGAAQSGGQTGPTGQPLGDGSLRLFVGGTSAAAAFGNSFDFAGVELADITNVGYWTYNADDPPLVRPSLRIEINPHLVADDTFAGQTEFTTLIHQPGNGTTGWQQSAGTLDDADWYLTGSEGTDMGCTQDTPCTFNEIRLALVNSDDDDLAPPAISSGIYFGLGTGVTTPTETAVDDFVFNDFEFDFEPMGVFVTPAN